MTDDDLAGKADAFPAPADDIRLLLTTAPPDVAHDLAGTLVREHLAACVSLITGARSVYRWEGAVQDDPETLLLVKTRADRLRALSARLEALHPYEVPEQLVLEPRGGGAAYVAWLRAACEVPATDTSSPARPQ